jgi:hypothetical protein
MIYQVFNLIHTYTDTSVEHLDAKAIYRRFKNKWLKDKANSSCSLYIGDHDPQLSKISKSCCFTLFDNLDINFNETVLKYACGTGTNIIATKNKILKELFEKFNIDFTTIYITILQKKLILHVNLQYILSQMK